MGDFPDLDAMKRQTAMRLTELTVFDEEQRVAILEMVKDGSLTIEEAVNEVKLTQPKLFETKYLGCVPSILYQTKPETHFESVLKQSHAALKKAKGAKVNMTVSSVGIKLTSATEEEGVLENDSMDTIIHHSVIPSSNKNFGYIVMSTRMGLWFTHIFQMGKAKEASAVVETISDRKAMTAPKVAHLVDEQDDDDFVEEALIAAHTITYMGSVDADNNRGDETIDKAVSELRDNLKGKKSSSPTQDEGGVASVIHNEVQAMLVISTDGLKVVDTVAREIVTNVLLSSISYQRPLKGKKAEMYCFIEVDDRRNAFICHIFVCDKNAKKQSQTIFEDLNIAIERAHKSGGNPFNPHHSPPAQYEGILESMQTPRRELQAVKAIGNGQFGKVYLARRNKGGSQSVSVSVSVNDEASNDEEEGDVDLVAVKLLRKNAVKDDGLEFLREAETMAQIGHHEMLVQLVGVVVKRKPWLLVLEYCQYGDLSDILKACRKKKIPLRLSEYIYVAEQIASGMEFITSKGYVHMDLACRNILLHHESRIRIADFGLTHKYDEGKSYYKQRGVMKLSIRWLAIDTYDHKIFSEKSDIWSFGITVWEVLSGGRQPYHGYKLKEVLDIVRNGTRLIQPKTTPDDLWELISSCWLRDPLHRPTFKQMRDKLNAIKRTHSSSQSNVRDIGKLLNKDLTENIKRITFKRGQTFKKEGEAHGLTGIIESIPEEGDEEE
eukprot:m.136548 g.136548  ORF g.136548 m.136548 type:complete len:720 (+) comp10742_c0_seq1:262-2421(+)